VKLPRRWRLPARGPAGPQDRYRALTTAAVMLVAVIAARVSYLHIVTLAQHYHQAGEEAYLLPFAVDGQVATSSLVLLRSARLGIVSPWLARLGLGLGVAATLAANVASGLPYGPVAAVLAGWPAVSFVVAIETAIGLTRRRARADRRRVEADSSPPQRAVTPAPAAAGGDRPPSDLVSGYRALVGLHPDLSKEQAAADLGVSARTLRRHLARAQHNGHRDLAGVP
jgi:hypothetical protein